MLLPQMTLKTTMQFNIILHVICMSFVCHSYVLVCDLYVIRMSSVCHSYVIHISLVCTCMSSVCHSYVLICHPYVTRMNSYVTRMSLVCQLYVTRMSLVCGFTMNRNFVYFCLTDENYIKSGNRPWLAVSFAKPTYEQLLLFLIKCK